MKTREMSCLMDAREKLLITTYQEVNDLFRSNTRCDDENVRDGGNTDLPEQHFHQKHKAYKVLLWLSWTKAREQSVRSPKELLFVYIC